MRSVNMSGNAMNYQCFGDVGGSRRHPGPHLVTPEKVANIHQHTGIQRVLPPGGEGFCCFVSLTQVGNSMNCHVLVNVGDLFSDPNKAPVCIPISADDAKPHEFTVFGNDCGATVRNVV